MAKPRISIQDARAAVVEPAERLDAEEVPPGGELAFALPGNPDQWWCERVSNGRAQLMSQFLRAFVAMV